MNVRSALSGGVFVRLLLSALLAGAALVLFLLQRSTLERPAEVRQRNVQEVVSDIDREVDSVLTQFHIEKRWIKKSQIPIPNAAISRTERRVLIPPDVVPVQMNQVLNAMARRYSARAVASENLKENFVTIHIELEGYIVQTIILKPNPEMRREAERNRQKKA